MPEFAYKGKTYRVAPVKGRGGLRLKIDGREEACELLQVAPRSFRIRVDGRWHSAFAAAGGDRAFVHIGGAVLEFEIPDAGIASSASHAQHALVDGRQVIFAPMPGRLVKISVSEGETVRPRQLLCVVEAMKMENEIRAALEGVVRSIGHAIDDLVGTDDPIMIIEVSGS
ncbi:MAG: hypothetical protein FJW35_07645 [Acidobacteria bacterium]|nr:hypothetical protein [Acidobacteriota bacterium]